MAEPLGLPESECQQCRNDPGGPAGCDPGSPGRDEEDGDGRNEESVRGLQPDHHAAENAGDDSVVEPPRVGCAKGRPGAGKHGCDRRQVGHVREPRPVRRQEVLLELRAERCGETPQQKHRSDRPHRGRNGCVAASVEAVGDRPDEHEHERHEQQCLEYDDHREPVQQRGAGDERHPAVEHRQAEGDDRLRNQAVRDRPFGRPVLGRVASRVPDPAVVRRPEGEPRHDGELDQRERCEQNDRSLREPVRPRRDGADAATDAHARGRPRDTTRSCARARRAATYAHESRSARPRATRRVVDAAGRWASTCPRRFHPQSR